MKIASQLMLKNLIKELYERIERRKIELKGKENLKRRYSNYTNVFRPVYNKNVYNKTNFFDIKIWLSLQRQISR